MSAITYPNTRRQYTADYTPRRKRIPVLLLLMAATVVALSAHAIIKHGQEAERVKQCLDKGGMISRWYQESSSRYVEVCQVSENQFGLHFLCRGGCKWEWKSITAFIKDNCPTYARLERWLSDGGYVKIWPK